MSDKDSPGSLLASPQKEADSNPTHSEIYYDVDGDLEILSSDKVLFKLPAYLLQGSRE